MMDNAAHVRRNELFQELKPCCVNLSQLTLKSDVSVSSLKELRDTTSQLLDILHRRCRSNAVFDDKLADYVFFPLQQVLKLCQKKPDRLAELATKCLRVLLESGWRTISIDLGRHLLILLTFFAEKSQSGSEELQQEAYGALATLFKCLHGTPGGVASLTEISTVPALGHCLSIILDGITDGPSSQTQFEALLALKCLWSCVKDQQARTDFLPGTISALTRSLVPTTKAPRSRRVLVNALEILQTIVTSTLSDVTVRILRDDSTRIEASTKTARLGRPWLKATGAQMKLALANIVKLRNHTHPEVLKGLSKLCLAILDECHSSLADSTTLLVETIMSLGSMELEMGEYSQTSLQDLASVHASIADTIKLVVYNWFTSLPRVMQSNDESAKQLALRQLSKAQDLLSGLDLGSEVLHSALSDSIRNSIRVLLELSISTRGVEDVSRSESSSTNILLSTEIGSVKQYPPILMPHESQIQTRESMDAIIAGIGASELQIRMAGEMVEYMRTTAGSDLLSAFWLSLRLLQAATSTTSVLDSLIDYTLTASDGREIVMGELYSQSMAVLATETDDELDWRLKALGLETVAYTARISGEAFRPDLVDVLYPIVNLLGSNNVRLSKHAIVSLNIISTSCGYESTSEMIIKNVDYLVNAVSLKLDTFDISSHAPQVLVMMIRLTGSSLLPYLDDVVVSIFAALDNFHGYPRLVESLFGVLAEIVEKGSKSSHFQVTAGPSLDHRKSKASESKIEDFVALLEKKITKASANEGNMHINFPREPWKDAGQLLDEMNDRQEEKIEEEDTDVNDSEFKKASTTKTYSMVQRIARLGQHYLTNQSPLLRRNLLDLIKTACDFLYRDEDQFLPLVNDIWPVLIKRLYDEEPYVAIAASGTLAEICRCAGDFMSTRIQVEWQRLMRLVRQVKTKAYAEKKGRYGRGAYSQNWQVWEGSVGLLVAVLEYVRINDDMFDEVLEVLADLFISRADVRTALCIINMDAVWLEELRQGRYPNIEAPILGDIKFASIDDFQVPKSQL